MKLFNQFTILKKNLRDLDYVKKNKVNYWTRECEEHPTNPHCLVYCDQQVILLFHRSNKLGINGLSTCPFRKDLNLAVSRLTPRSYTRVQKPFSLMKITSKTLSLLLNVAFMLFVFVI